MGFMMVLSFALYTIAGGAFYFRISGQKLCPVSVGAYWSDMLCFRKPPLQRGCRIYRRRNTGGRAGVFWDGKKRSGNRAVKKKRERYRNEVGN